MKIYLRFLIALVFIISTSYAQTPLELTQTTKTNFLKPGTTDTLKFAVAGGLNAAQFSNVDINGDNVKDLFVFERTGNKVLPFLRLNNQWVYAPQYENAFPKLYNWALLMDYNCDGKEDIFSDIDYTDFTVLGGGIRLVKNTSAAGQLNWQQVEKQFLYTQKGFSNPSNVSVLPSDIPGIADVDGDGDVDFVCFPLGSNRLSYFKNMSKEDNGNCDSIHFKLAHEGWGFMYYLVNKNQFSINDDCSFCFQDLNKHGGHNGASICLLDLDGDADKDMIYGDVTYHNMLKLTNGKEQSPLGRDSIISQDTAYLANTRKAEIESFPAAYIADADNDGLKDLLICPNATEGAKNANNVWFYKNSGTNAAPNFSFIKDNFLQDEMIDLGSRTAPTFVDIDGDGDEDLVVATSGDFGTTRNAADKLVLYTNKGTAGNPVFQLTDSNFLNISSPTPMSWVNATFGDLNGDGKPDLILGDFNGYLHYYTNQSIGSNFTFTKVSSDFNSINCGSFTTPQLVDLNKDGKRDLVIGRKNGTLAYYQNNGTTAAPAFTVKPTIDSLGGVVAIGKSQSGQYLNTDGYSVPHVCDLDNNGVYEMYVGSQDGRVRFYGAVTSTPGAVFQSYDKIYRNSDTSLLDAATFGTYTAPAVAKLNADDTPDLMIGNKRGGLMAYLAKVNMPIGVSGVEIPKNEISVYPNPAKNELFVQFENQAGTANFTIYNAVGQLLNSGKATSKNAISIQNLEAGIYFICFETHSHQKQTKHFVVAR